MMYDTKGRFHMTPIKKEECEYKLLRVNKIRCGEKGIYYGTCHDGHNLRFLGKEVRAGDSVKFNLKTGKIEEVFKMRTNQLA